MYAYIYKNIHVRRGTILFSYIYLLYVRIVCRTPGAFFYFFISHGQSSRSAALRVPFFFSPHLLFLSLRRGPRDPEERGAVGVRYYARPRRPSAGKHNADTRKYRNIYDIVVLHECERASNWIRVTLIFDNLSRNTAACVSSMCVNLSCPPIKYIFLFVFSLKPTQNAVSNGLPIFSQIKNSKKITISISRYRSSVLILTFLRGTTGKRIDTRRFFATCISYLRVTKRVVTSYESE